MNIFWDTITHYNAGTWIYQVIITLIGIILTCSLFKSPTKKIKVATTQIEFEKVAGKWMLKEKGAFEN